MNNVLLTVLSSTSSKNGGFVLKLQNKQTISLQTAFGMVVQQAQTTFYMKVQAGLAIGFQAQLDIDSMQVVERPFQIPAESAIMAPDGVTVVTPAKPSEVVQLKWLHLKPQNA